MDPESDSQGNDQRNAQVDNAIRAIQEKKPVPEIDFTIHMMEDGSQVSTMERVCKGVFAISGIEPAMGIGIFNALPRHPLVAQPASPK